MEDRHDARDDAGEQERLPTCLAANRHPQDHQRDQGEAEAEQRRALRHQVRQDGVETLIVVVRVAIQRVLARKMYKCANPEVPEVTEEVNETKASTEQENENGERGRGAAGNESLGGQVEHAWKSKPEHAARHYQRRGEAAAQRHEVRGEEIDHEGIAEAVARGDWILAREVVPGPEKPGAAAG